MFRSPPSSRSRRGPRMYASAACRWRWRENSGVAFTGIPAAIVSSIAVRPASVPGILTNVGLDVTPHDPVVDKFLRDSVAHEVA